MIYYPLPLYQQKAFQQYVDSNFKLGITESLCNEVISLPIHTEMEMDSMEYVCTQVKSFFNN